MSLAKTGFGYQRGLADLGRGSFAWMQPDGSWGRSNAGLITDGEESLLVDTLFDLRLTREMLAAMRSAAPKAAARIGTLVNTHHNGDHCFGAFDFEGITPKLPTTTFSGRLTREVGDKTGKTCATPKLRPP